MIRSALRMIGGAKSPMRFASPSGTMPRSLSASTTSDIFTSANLERTIRELNDESTRKKIFGGYEPDGTARQSSVLIPLCQVEGKPSILFNLRSNRLSRHKGYPCFPGGVAEEGDKDCVHTALRETHEELGLEPKNIKVIGNFPKFKMPRDNMEITAVLADIGDLNSHTLTINYEEVSLVFSRTIDELVDPVNTGETAFRGTKATVLYTTPVFLAGPFKIWGVTAMLLHILLGRLVPEVYRRPLRPVTFHRIYTPKE